MDESAEVESPIVDVHCHLFNATDLPIRGFVQHVQLHNGWLADKLAPIAARLTAGAPTFEADVRRLEGLLEGGNESASIDTVAQNFEAETATAVDDLSDEERRAIAEALGGNKAPGADEGGAEFGISDIPRYVKWAKLFSRSRLELAQLYAGYFSPRPTLAIPMLVDLEHGVSDRASTEVADQVRVFALLRKISMLGLLPGAEDLHLHPFVGFDPFRVLDDRLSPDGRTALQVVQDALLTQGFVGVKVYPEMGWRADGNNAANAGSHERALKLNGILDNFFGWCDENDVPITAHCNHSNYALEHWGDAGFGNPDEWFPVLRRHARLRVNLGHFGGAHPTSDAYSWAWTIANHMQEFEDRLFADVGCHRLNSRGLKMVHFDVLEEMTKSSPAILRQLMLGTDWYMVAGIPQAEDFISNYRDEYLRFGSEATNAFMGGNALRFLGVGHSDPEGNSARMRKQYAALGASTPSWLGQA